MMATPVLLDGVTAEEQRLFVKRLQEDPVFHIEEVQGVKTLEPYQREMAREIAANDRVAVSACHAVGKTFFLARIILWFTSVFPGAKVITTAPTGRQVKLLLWSEIRSGFARSLYPLGGTMLQTSWTLDPDWYAVGFTARIEAGEGEGQGAASSFQGFHSKYVLVVFDEATGVPAQIWKQVEGLLTSGAVVKFVAIANPTDPTGDFAKCFKQRGWRKIKLSCFDSPNLKANGITNLEELRREVDHCRGLTDDEFVTRLKSYKLVQMSLIKLSWVIEMALKWGLDHPLFLSKVLGEFPAEGENVQIPLRIVEAAQARHPLSNDEPMPDQSKTKIRSIGVDPARYGPDATVIAMFDDDVQTLRKPLSKKDTGEVTGEIIALVRSLPRVPHERIVVDGTGLGSGVVDQLRAAQREKKIPQHVEIREVHFGGGLDTPQNKEDYFNLKALMFDWLSRDLKGHLKLMPEVIYAEQLPTIQYRFHNKGQLMIESKDDYKKRTGLSSPDDADALALANLGRYTMGNVGTFTSGMAKNKGRGTMSGSLKSGAEW